MNTSRFPAFLTIFGFILIGVLSRVLPHLPNFTALNAITLFSAALLSSKRASLFVVLSTLFLSDLILGFHATMPFVYLSYVLILVMGFWMKKEVSLKSTMLSSVGASLLFFAITNFGVWLSGSLYLQTIEGLGFCYLAAIPFLTNQILGDLAYSSLLIGYFYAIQKFVPTKLYDSL